MHGVGPETADSILLYVAARPVFVIDAYTRRITGRLGLVPRKVCYDACQRFFQRHLEADVETFNEFHALIICLGKEVCRPTPRCAACCLKDGCAYARKQPPS